MALGFIICQIGNPEIDVVCSKAIVPALKDCGFEPKRIDKHNEGGLLKSEIIDLLHQAEIIVSDVTNERPNCYLEIGYTMGIDKFRNLILTAREDHSTDSPNYNPKGPKVHFDLAGYDVLYWIPEKLQEFREELRKRIQRRQAIISPSGEPTTGWDTEWIKKHEEQALKGFANLPKIEINWVAMKVTLTLTDYKLQKKQSELLQAAEKATVHTFGWPIGVVMTREGASPQPRTDGIVAEVFAQTYAEALLLVPG